MKTDRCVYVLFRPDNGQPFYVGKGHPTRPWDHFQLAKKKRSYKDNLILKFQREGLEVPIVTIRDGMTHEEAFSLEIELISTIGRTPYGPLVNQTRGGDGRVGDTRSVEERAKASASLRGQKRSDETRAKMSESFRGRIMTPETRQKLREANLGKTHSAESRKKMSDSHMGKKHTMSPEGRAAIAASNRTPEMRAKISAANTGKKRTGQALENMRAARHDWMTGKTHTPEVRERLRQTNLGRICSPEKRKKISEARMGQKPSEETLEKLSISQKGQSFHDDPAYKEKLSAALKGRVMTDEWKAKLKEAWVRRKARQQTTCQTNPPNHVSASTQPAL